ncbi:probable protein phosphatase 2C 48 [Amaranthus tricolor]|uniref:probable protein phosphatase 2C 48 n=1 Tax=Amaranthus tricolor TaxID=29722 RepID=UPI0025830567|nr:probable protein phosphatase 2C 48 [Amaranthus tricolor]
MVFSCLKPFWEGYNVDNEKRDSKGKVKGLMWYKDLGEHIYGEFSMAVMQANEVVEDRSQVESGPFSSLSDGPTGTFFGIYDGHGGPQAACFVNNNLFQIFKNYVQEQEVTEEVIKKAYLATDEEFLKIVKKEWIEKPHLASQGTCCLVGIICNEKLYVANAGDSRVVLGRLDNKICSTKGLRAMQLSTDHNAKMETEREELQSLHPHDPDIVVLKHKAWRVKGIIQVTRSIGDVYLKSSEFSREPLPEKYIVPEGFNKPILRADPSISILKLQPEDRFLIFASDGLWDHLSNQEAVDIVYNYPRNGIARKLVKAALHEAANKREMRYCDLKRIEAGIRRHFHDDITVIVVFLDDLQIRSSFLNNADHFNFSIKGGADLLDYHNNIDHFY